VPPCVQIGAACSLSIHLTSVCGEMYVGRGDLFVN